MYIDFGKIYMQFTNRCDARGNLTPAVRMMNIMTIGWFIFESLEF